MKAGCNTIDSLPSTIACTFDSRALAYESECGSIGVPSWKNSTRQSPNNGVKTIAE